VSSRQRRRLVAWGAAAALVVVIGTSVSTRVAVREVVPDVVADPVLAACVERSLGVGGGSAVAPDRFDEVYLIDCAWRGDGDRVTSLAGLERLTSVREIDLTGQDVHDLGPLAALTGLTSLRLTNNAAVADLSALDGLPLANLGLSGTGVADLQPLARTTSLQWVGLGQTGVSDLGPLARSVGLLELDVSHAAVVDLSPLAGAASLSKLDVRDNHVADVTPLASLPALDELWIGGNPVADLRPLLDAPALLGVDVEGLDLQTPGIEELRAAGVYVGGQA
jgi:Leucine-rich repeat (LRR) protein